MNSLKKWKALHHLNKEFVSQIKLFCVFGENGNEVLVINKNDEVFGFGHNENGCLGFRTDNSIQEPIKINELSNKGIIKFSYGLSHVIAITSSGQTYSWGSNNFGQLGDGTTDNRNKPKLIESLINENVIESSCGAYFTLVLTQSGDVYSFGYNCFGQLGCNNTYDQKIPIKVTGFESEKVISLSCGYEHSLALTQNGHVFAWGGNDLGQLGIDNREDQYIPTKVKNLDSITIKKIVCGSAHNLILSTDGDVYTFGYNFKGQIGSGNYNNQCTPFKVNDSEKFIDIAAIFYNDLSVALSLSGNCFIWGQTEGLTDYIPIPKDINSQSIDDVFAEYAFRKVTYKPIVIQ